MTLDIPDELIDWRAKGFWLPEGAGRPRATSPRRGTPSSTVRSPGRCWSSGTPRCGRTSRRWPRYAAAARLLVRPARQDVDGAQRCSTPSCDAGAWALTVATASQALVLRRLGVPRVLIANEVLDPTALRWLAAESAAGWEVFLQVDSVAGVEAVAAGGRAAVLVELGHARRAHGLPYRRRGRDGGPGGRRCARSALVGVTAYEGALTDVAEVDAFLATLVEAARAMAGLLPAEVHRLRGRQRLVRPRDQGLRRAVARPGTTVRAVLRSGASVTHDDGFYRERTPFNREPGEGSLTAGAGDLRAGAVHSGAGAGDRRHGQAGRAVRRGPARSTAAADRPKMNDHHTYVRGGSPAVGDLVRFGLSHPCTAFDKWRFIPVADDADVVVDVLHTYFDIQI